jgi:hypothetical protein
MLIIFNGKECYGCPFFNFDHVVDHGACEGTRPVCNLDGLVPVDEDPLVIKIEDPSVRPEDCPWEDVHFRTLGSQIHVENHRDG